MHLGHHKCLAYPATKREEEELSKQAHGPSSSGRPSSCKCLGACLGERVAAVMAALVALVLKA